jgi:hypothetical protein
VPTDFSSFKRIEGVPAVAAATTNTLGRVAVLVKMRKGAVRPSYVIPRAEFGPDMFSAEINHDQLPRLNADPAVASISLSEPLSRID